MRRYVGRLHALGVRRKFGIVPVPPCYFVREGLNSDSLVVDCGTGPDANFSVAMIDRFGVRSIGFEPTRKHHAALEAVVAATAGQFAYRPLAIAGGVGTARFHESRRNISGSLFTDHVNIRVESAVEYDVATAAIDDLFGILGVSQIDVLKLDIEGAEYEALAVASDEAFGAIDQLIVEFHDHCLDRYTPRHTRTLVRRLEATGFRTHVVDGIDFLFFRA